MRATLKLEVNAVSNVSEMNVGRVVQNGLGPPSAVGSKVQ